MIHIGACEPLRAVKADLAAWQTEVDASMRPYAAHIEAAEEAFSRRRRQVPFVPVTDLLRAMCSGVTRCMYCHDSGGVDVEHYRPKAWYPEIVFEWANFLLVCTRCNRKKSSRFPLFHPTPGVVRPLTRKKDAVPRRPPAAAPVLLNPRVDDPSAHLTLDLAGTFNFVELGARDSVPWLRAHHTIEVLDLNDDDLPRARRAAYNLFLSNLRLAGIARQQNDLAEVARTRDAITTAPCAVVWREMQQQRASQSVLCAAFAAVPEAATW